MTKNTLALSTVTLVLLIGGWLIAAAAGRSGALRSRHSEPATASPPPMVAVTSDGKLYHRPDCTYIHGPVRMESGEQATVDGYTPCTRCLKVSR